MLGFSALRELCGDELLPPPLPGPRPYYALPTWPPWTGPVVDAHRTHVQLVVQRMREGKCPPAHTFSEFSSPPTSEWWPAAIQDLHQQADTEARNIKYSFGAKHPEHFRILHSPDFVKDRARLHGLLASTQAVFWIQAFVLHGMTASEAAQKGAIQGSRATAATEYARYFDPDAYITSVSSDEFLAASLCRPSSEVGLWGTVDDPRNPALVWATGVQWCNGAPWGMGDWADDSTNPWNSAAWGGIVAPPPPSPPPSRKRRWFPRFYGHRWMGAIFRPPPVSRAGASDCGSVGMAGCSVWSASGGGKTISKSLHK
ncbi:hypothetical protein K438DRAFT_1956292 [Mycena galopus ATCC 62051]|nr:hypothetical protein K438DRAFT_1975717 [Mycena galopus ATCC 62051]KAF8214205.1 hypothetical protein K438DRAFT_1956292 [Mycena galopus ATCC 62051]